MDQLPSNLLVAGDLTSNASLQNALESGQRAAEVVGGLMKNKIC